MIGLTQDKVVIGSSLKGFMTLEVLTLVRPPDALQAQQLAGPCTASSRKLDASPSPEEMIGSATLTLVTVTRASPGRSDSLDAPRSHARPTHAQRSGHRITPNMPCKFNTNLQARERTS